MKLTDYIKDCLKNDNFKITWDIENPEYPSNLFEKLYLKSIKELSLQEALTLLEDIDDSKLQSVIDNKGIKFDNIDEAIKTEIIFYENNNNCPVATFLDSISDNKLKSKTLKNIFQLAILGNASKPPLSKYVDDGIFELRTKQGSNIDRIFYFFIFGNKIIMTNGYIKKSQKLDDQEFNRAKKYRDDYMKQFR